MRNKILFLSVLGMIFCASSIEAQPGKQISFVNAADYGFSPDASGIKNMIALQAAIDQTGTIVVSEPGTYKIAGVVWVGSNTSVIFGNSIYLKKVDEQGKFSHVICNKGARTKTWDENITIEGLQIIVNGMDVRRWEAAYGLHGQLSFFYVKDLKVDRFRCKDIGRAQYGIHVCTFEDIVINDVIIEGNKDGVHLGTGKRFTISNGVFRTFDDAVALNAHDYSVGNPEYGWIEDGLVENCYDLLSGDRYVGFFCRILAGAWIDWKEGMEVQQSDIVVSNGRLYRVQARPDSTIYTSTTPPSHESGQEVLDSIPWGMVQDNVCYTAGVRNVTFRNIYLEKPRIGFSIHFDNDAYSRSYYPGAKIPKQEQLVFDNIRVLHDSTSKFLSIGTPIDVMTICNTSFKSGSINFHGNDAMPDYLTTKINIYGSVFNKKGEMDLVTNEVDGKVIVLKTSSNMEIHDEFKANVVPGDGKIIVDSDLTGLKKRRNR